MPNILENFKEAWNKITNAWSNLFNRKSPQEELAEELVPTPSLENYEPENMDWITKSILDIQLAAGEIT
jgi:hypothetical protein